MKLSLRYLLAIASIILTSSFPLYGQCPSAAITTARAQSGSNYNLNHIATEFKNPHSDLALITAHRGYWEYCPESTIEGFQAAIDYGIEEVEMDVRVSAPGSDSNGKSYPNGEIFLTHDWDLRGEAPGPLGVQADNNLYTLKPSQIESRTMVDRHGIASIDSAGEAVTMHSFTDLLTSYVARAKAQSGAIQASGGNVCGNTDGDAALLVRGAFLILDVKGGEKDWNNPVYGTPIPGMVGQYDTMQEAFRELGAFECQNNIDLSLSIAFKLSGNRMPTTAAEFQTDVNTNLVGGINDPYLILIVFDNDIAKSGYTAMLQDYRAHYGAYLGGDWQLTFPGNTLEPYVESERAAGYGVAGFQGNSAYPEGYRNSDATCLQSEDPLPPNPTPCNSQPLAWYASSSIDFLIPPPSLGISRMSAITTDNFKAALLYLNTIGMHNTTHIQ
ncbi:glycerophosphodiester phosphodiesterase [Granulicella arctica]|uniref:GP-PDE domain-containing protein n=1 Tax=Granulicella arctica TaxID=940613 RepID=A0A7Y9PJ52_9BACT|nr:glycerophosphodiester phosphodiesterase family protein [Granulicella arctica]NYF80857.1 hypothetical protein [Granulicella arctica]